MKSIFRMFGGEAGGFNPDLLSGRLEEMLPTIQQVLKNSSEVNLLCSFGLSTINDDLDRSTLSSATQQQPLLSVFVSQSSSGCYFSTSCYELSSCDVQVPMCHANYNQPAQLV